MRRRTALATGVMTLLLGLVEHADAETVRGRAESRIRTSEFNPASPDPSGIVYFRRHRRFLISDSEVDERTGAGQHRINLWNIRPSGSVVSKRTTRRFSREPTGLGFDPARRRLFISDDDANRIWIVREGRDGRFGTADDRVRSINVKAHGSSDAEDPAFDRWTGHLFFLDGDRTEIYRIDPVDRAFGNANDKVWHFDVGRLGPANFEALSFDPSRNKLLVGGSDERIYEITRKGRLLRVINVSQIRGLKRISGIARAPASKGSGAMHYWIVDRGVDNDSHPNENDGDLWEVSVMS
jgi:hypothetical protein